MAARDGTGGSRAQICVARNWLENETCDVACSTLTVICNMYIYIHVRIVIKLSPLSSKHQEKLKGLGMEPAGKQKWWDEPHSISWRVRLGLMMEKEKEMALVERVEMILSLTLVEGDLMRGVIG